MERQLAKQANRAHRQEMQAERKEARLHAKAANQAIRGNVGRAINLECRAQNQAVRAQNAHAREQAASAAYVANVARAGHYHPPPHCPPPVMPTAPIPGVTTYTVTQTTYAPGPPASAYYPVGQHPPPPYSNQPPPAGFAPTPYPY